MLGGMPGGRLSGSSSGRSKGFSSGLLGGGGGRSRTGLSGVAQAPAFNRTKVLLFMCLPCISDCLSIFPNRSHDKLISDMLICVACRRRNCHMLGRLARHLRYGRASFLRRAMKRYGRPQSSRTGLQSYRACDEGGRQYGCPDLRSSAQQPGGSSHQTLRRLYQVN